MEHKDDAPIVIVGNPFAYQCLNCPAAYKVGVHDEGEKATRPGVEFSGV